MGVTKLVSTAKDYRKKKIIDFAELSALRKRHPGMRIVQAHGVFDVLHAGHLAYFESAKKFGDLLVVTVTADRFVNKGPGRPYFNGNIRANMLAALEVVDYVAINFYPTAVPAIEALKPHFYVKGPDYKVKAKDVSGGIYLEEQAVIRAGGKLVFTDDETSSSSTLLNDFFKIWNEKQQQAIDRVKAAGGMPVIEQVFERMSQERVRVIGEPIVDTYVFVRPESISSKSPSVSARYQYEEDYAGGSLAIVNNLSDFVAETKLITTHGTEPYFKNLLNEKLNPRVDVISEELPSIPTPRKTRFITVDHSNQRIFEVTNLRNDQWYTHSPENFCDLIAKNVAAHDAVLLADFGHGLFEGDVMKAVGRLPGFIGVNVQTNSSNFGFNPFTKHQRMNYLSIDTKEARLAYHDRFTAPLDLARRIRDDLGSRDCSISITLGPDGAVHFTQSSKSEFDAPAFTDNVVDATGAGDAFFAMSTMLVKAGCPAVMVPFVSNIFAGLKTKIIGNKSAISKAQLFKTLTYILK
jgi:rfaE bifunctional protein nucleotidyltransferase chain/domain